jgi:hypothetical protein
VAQIDRRLERILVERMYEDSVTSHVHVTKEERRSRYDSDPSKYQQPASRRFATVTRRSAAAADSLVAALRAGAVVDSVIAADNRAGFTGGAIHDLREDEHGPFKKIVYEELKPGGVTTLPVDKQGRVMVVQLLAVTPARQLSFEEAQNTIDDDLRADKADVLLKQLLGRLSRGHEIAMRPDLVMRIRMVDPATDF